MSELVISTVVGVITTLALAELLAWLPTWNRRLVALHARRLPPPMNERMKEEWESVLASLPGSISGFLFAIDLARAVPVVRTEVLYPGLVRVKTATAIAIRIVELAIAIYTLVLVAPILALVSVALKIEDWSAPVMARKTSYGMHGKPFTRYWFRTRGRDGHLTRVGRVLDVLDLDTVPELWGVLRGHMSIVGPRGVPTEAINNLSGRERRILSVRPGISGPKVLPENIGVRGSDSFRRELLWVERGVSWAAWGSVMLNTFVFPLRAHKLRKQERTGEHPNARERSRDRSPRF